MRGSRHGHVDAGATSYGRRSTPPSGLQFACCFLVFNGTRTANELSRRAARHASAPAGTIADGLVSSAWRSTRTVHLKFERHRGPVRIHAAAALQTNPRNPRAVRSALIEVKRAPAEHPGAPVYLAHAGDHQRGSSAVGSLLGHSYQKAVGSAPPNPQRGRSSVTRHPLLSGRRHARRAHVSATGELRGHRSARDGGSMQTWRESGRQPHWIVAARPAEILERPHVRPQSHSPSAPG